MNGDEVGQGGKDWDPAGVYNLEGAGIWAGRMVMKIPLEER